ncbi:MAG: tRNA (N(6)-L-threonylcarbamoyladenosine(37)-C(2))-methylthiotransferase MtaB [Nitrospirales bacterium]|nr:tRNA (N(6)-L-threonylcarbamoyladenosine(37)-C(2))-methylthiotransferase MtaB [Nitrospirales bacterium]
MEPALPKPRTVSIHTIGCRLNQAESAILTNRLKAIGYELVPFGQATDLLVLNTCSVTENAEADCRYAVRKTLRHSPHAFIAVTGCYAQTGMTALQAIPGIDLILGNQYKMALPNFVADLPHDPKRTTPEIRHADRMDRDDFLIEGVGEYQTTRANLKIQDGCNFMCSFCLIPFARGRERSRDCDDAIREAEGLVARGHQELVLTGVNIGRFGRQERDLINLIERLEAIHGLERIRISSIEPTTIPDELLDYMASSTKLCRYLHVPLQSGDDAILRAMNRRYSVKDYRQWVEHAICRVPGVCVGTDVMVGFPGEGELEFANTHAFLRDLPFAYFHVFSYSERPGTAVCRLSNPVSSLVIKHRNATLTKLSRAKRLAFYQRIVGQTVSVLFESKGSHGLWVGLTDHFIRVGVPTMADVQNTQRTVLVTGIMGEVAVGQFSEPIDSSRRHNALPLLVSRSSTSVEEPVLLDCHS